jgi:hypothetical protein
MHIVVFSWSSFQDCSFMHACFVCLYFYCRGYFKVFNIPEYFNWLGLYLLVLRLCNDAVISRFNHRSGVFFAGNLFHIPPQFLSTRLLIAFS